MIRGHMDTLISQLRVMGVEGKERVNIKDWISYTTFDIIGKPGAIELLERSTLTHNR